MQESVSSVHIFLLTLTSDLTPPTPPHPGTLNQNNWAKKFPSCSSARQSPVDLQESLAQVRLQYQGLSFDGWEEPSGGRTTAKNDGKTGEARGPQ